MRGVFWIDVFREGIYTKNLDESQPKLFYDGYSEDYCHEGKNLKPFLDENFLLCSKNRKFLIIPIKDDLTFGQVRVILQRDSTCNEDFASFQDKILLMTWEKLSLFRMKNKKRIFLQNEIEVERINEKEGRPISLSICSRGRFIIIHRMGSNYKVSSLMIYDMINLEKKKILDISELKVSPFRTMSFLKYCGNRFYFSGITSSDFKNTLYTYYYDVEENAIEEEGSFRKVDVVEADIHKFVRKGDGLIVGISDTTRLLSINFE